MRRSSTLAVILSLAVVAVACSSNDTAAPGDTVGTSGAAVDSTAAPSTQIPQ